MELNELIYYQANKKRLDRIKNNKKNIVPFVGAGVSKSCGLYLWQELLDKLAIDYFTSAQIHSLKAANDLFGYADKIVTAAGNIDMIMKRIGEIFDEAEVVHTEIPSLLVSSFSPLVITTNYDTLLEEASGASPVGPIKPLLPCHVGQMHEAIMLNDRRLLKLHGSVEEISSLILTTKQYKNYYGQKWRRGNRILPIYLKNIFEGKKVLFVGCSLDKDYTLDILQECVKRNHTISHFAIVPYLSNPEQRVKRQRKLTKLGIEAIYYPEGNFEAVGQLIQYLANDTV